MARASTGRPTMNDVARASGVSNATVSYVLNERSGKSIPEPTRSKVLAAAAELGYVRNTAAATLRRGHSNVILLVVDGTYTGEVSARTVANITDGLAGLGCTVLVHTLRETRLLLDAVHAVQPVGVMLLAFIAPDVREEILKAGAQHIGGYEQMPGETEEAARFWEVSIGAAQVRHLADAGHTDIAYVMPDASPRAVVARSRLIGAREEAVRLGLPEPLAVTAPLDRASLVPLLPPLRERGITALSAHEDTMAMAILAAMADLGLRAPHDLAVIGADNDAQSALTVPALTSVALPDYDYGPVAARAFAAAFAGEPVDARAVLAGSVQEPVVHRRDSA